QLYSSLSFKHIMTRSWRTKASVLLVIAAAISALATFSAFRDVSGTLNNSDVVIWLLNIDLIILLLLVSLIARRIVGLWSGRKRRIAGSHLHVRLVYIFSIIAAVPTIIMTVFSVVFFHYGVQTWFSERVQTAINESQAVAQSYMEEHKQVIRADTMAMAGDLDRQSDILMFNPETFQEVVNTQSFIRNLSEALVFREDGRVIARSALTFALEYEAVPEYIMQRAKTGEVVLMTGEDQDRVRALVKLENFPDTFLFVGRMLDPQVLSHLSATQLASDDYASLKAQYSGLQITVTMLFVVVGFLLLLAAIWFGLILARQLVKPISELIIAADRVRGGDLTFQVPENKTLEEFDYLAQSFNRMTSQIHKQRTDLIEANRQLDYRRRVTETVLAGVSSGVIGVDKEGTVNLVNNAALTLLGMRKEDLLSRKLIDVIPELSQTMESASRRIGKITRKEVQLHGGGGKKRSFIFQITIELGNEEDKNIIVTFDDITALQSAQRKAAWSDVARRIAHEIKNPLTPIQLSAERLRRKYKDSFQEEESKVFDQCIETIIRHVGDIGGMVDEFSSFARMPEPVLKAENLPKQIKESLMLQQQAHPEIIFSLEFADDVFAEKLCAEIDSRQFRQAMTNILQNAVDAIHSVSGKGKQGRVEILTGYHGQDEIFVSISDNGAGFPEDSPRDKLTEPYVTHKQKGTGLGLAIVKKIMEDCNGSLVLGVPDWLAENRQFQNPEGATLVMLFPVPLEKFNKIKEGEKLAS
ncbi:MAG: PAS domain-containing sensor histidine kinase, partial [Alphaproteobacteria bacterium]|nr:PAS domain-containing sensor histidine kinase [Alphaproteobacteria bacterium]